MWSSKEDRDTAERRARKLTPAQQSKRDAREQSFNAGFNAAMVADYDSKVVAMHPLLLPWKLDLTKPSYVEQRRQRFEAWEFAEDRA